MQGKHYKKLHHLANKNPLVVDLIKFEIKIMLKDYQIKAIEY